MQRDKLKSAHTDAQAAADTAAAQVETLRAELADVRRETAAREARAAEESYASRKAAAQSDSARLEAVRAGLQQRVCCSLLNYLSRLSSVRAITQPSIHLDQRCHSVRCD